MSKRNYLSTSQVAQMLGVSTATIKRWVDEDILPAHKTAGGHRRLLLDDVQRLVKQNHFPQASFSLLGLSSEKDGGEANREASVQLHEALLEGNSQQVRALLEPLFRRGVPVEMIADHVICPALAEVGEDWAKDKIDVYEEHRATRTCEVALAERKRSFEQSADDDSPVAVGGCPEHDPTVISSLLIQMMLLENGWRAINFGPHTPMSSLRNALRDLRPQLVWLTITHPVVDAAQFSSEYLDFYRAAEALRIPVALGGRGLTEELRSRIPYTMFGDGIAQLAAFARTLHSGYRRPRRGRPPGT